MTPFVFMMITFGVALGAGLLGSLLGLGGGIIVVPALSLLLKIDVRYAIGASIVSVIATSSGAGAAYVRDRMTNIRVAMYLELATTAGALIGALLAGVVGSRWLFITFGAVMAYTAVAMWRYKTVDVPGAVGVRDGWAERFNLHGSYFDAVLNREVSYTVARSRIGFFVSAAAGVLSGLLGIGGGVIKVPMMNLLMGIPLKVASATSSFMIGVTAAASAGVYFARGDIDPFIAAPVAVGVLLGAMAGARVMGQIHHAALRTAFSVILLIVAVQMIFKGLR